MPKRPHILPCFGVVVLLNFLAGNTWAVSSLCPDGEHEQHCRVDRCGSGPESIEIATGEAIAANPSIYSEFSGEFLNRVSVIRAHRDQTSLLRFEQSVGFRRGEGEGFGSDRNSVRVVCSTSGVRFLVQGKESIRILVRAGKPPELHPADSARLNQLWSKRRALAGHETQVLQMKSLLDEVGSVVNLVEQRGMLSLLEAHVQLSRHHRTEAHRILVRLEGTLPSAWEAERLHLLAEWSRQEEIARPLVVKETVTLDVQGVGHLRVPPGTDPQMFWLNDEICIDDRHVWKHDLGTQRPLPVLRCWSTSSRSWRQTESWYHPKELRLTTEYGDARSCIVPGINVVSFEKDDDDDCGHFSTVLKHAGSTDVRVLLAVVEPRLGEIDALFARAGSLWVQTKRGEQVVTTKQASELLRAGYGSRLVSGARLVVLNESEKVLVAPLRRLKDTAYLPVETPLIDEVLVSPDGNWIALLSSHSDAEKIVLVRVELQHHK